MYASEAFKEIILEKMFQLVLNSFEKIEKIIAPSLDSEVEFKYHCDSIIAYFSDESNLEEINSKLIEDTQLSRHLNEVMRLLLEDNQRLFLSTNDRMNELKEINGNQSASVQELNPTLNNNLKHNESSNRNQNESSINTEITISPFMEHILSNKIIEILINAAKMDRPTGTSLHCYKFLSKLINDYKLNLLNHSSICNSINELISLCAINVAGPYESAQIEFLSIIVNKIQLNNNLIFCFSRHDFPLLTSLLSMLSSPDNQVANKAGQLIIDLVSITNEEISKIILNRTLFKNKIIENLIYHYKQIPSSLKPEDIETVINFYQDENQSLNDNLLSLSYPVRKFLTFFKWFSFLDLVLMKCKSSSLIESLLEVFKQEFLINNLSSNLFLRDEINLKILSTILTYACLKHSKSNLLKESIIGYLVDEENLIITENDLSNQINQTDHNQPNEQDNKEQDKNQDKNKPLNRLHILIDRCRIKISEKVDFQFLFKLNLMNDEEKEVYCSYLLSLYSLQLFEEILNKPSKQLFERLFINNLVKRSYLDVSKYNINNDLKELEDLTKLTDFNLVINEDENECPSSLLNNPAIKSIKYFVALIPNELKSCTSDFGFEPYVNEAQKKFDECLSICENWKWDKEILDNYFVETKDQTTTGDDFAESEFISMLFDNLTNIIQIPYELNLQVSLMKV